MSFVIRVIAAFFYWVLARVSLKFVIGKKLANPIEFLRTQCLVFQGAQIGEGTLVRDHVFVAFPKNLKLGRNITVGPHSRFFNYSEVSVGDDTELGPGLHIQTNEHLFPDKSKPLGKQGAFTEPVSIGRGVYVGANVTISKGVSVRDLSIVAAGALVVKDVETGHIFGGVPAKSIGLIP